MLIVILFLIINYANNENYEYNRTKLLSKWFSCRSTLALEPCKEQTRSDCGNWQKWIRPKPRQYSVWDTLANPDPNQVVQPPSRPTLQSMCQVHCTASFPDAQLRCGNWARMCRRIGTAAFLMDPKTDRSAEWWMQWARPTAWASPRTHFDTMRPSKCIPMHKTV